MLTYPLHNNRNTERKLPQAVEAGTLNQPVVSEGPTPNLPRKETAKGHQPNGNSTNIELAKSPLLAVPWVN